MGRTTSKTITSKLEMKMNTVKRANKNREKRMKKRQLNKLSEAMKSNNVLSNAR